MQALPELYYKKPVEGVNLDETTLDQLVGADPHLLVFLRHFG